MFDLFWFRVFRWFDKNSDGGSGAGTGAGTADEETEDSTGGEDTEKAGDDKSKKPAEITFSSEQQALVDRLVGDARTKEREKAKTEATAQAARDKKKADEEAQIKNQEWQQLAESRATEIVTLTQERDELAPWKDIAEKYKVTLDGMLAETKKGLPKHLLPLLDKMDPVEALEYLSKHAKELNIRAASYPETPEEKEHSLSKDEENEGRHAVGRVITSSF